MSGNRGSEFGEMQPKNLAAGIVKATTFQTIPVGSIGDLDLSVITPIAGSVGPTQAPNGAFRPGQQILFRLGIANPPFPQEQGPDNYLTYVQLKLWWLVETLEKRAPGMLPGPADLPADSGWKPVDKDTFGAGPVGGADGSFQNNRYCWIPAPKRLDLTEFITAPPPPSQPRTSDSLLLDDVLALQMPAPTAPFLANFSADQTPARWVTFLYPSYGYALGVTAITTAFLGLGTMPPLKISMQWSVGTLGGTLYQENIG